VKGEESESGEIGESSKQVSFATTLVMWSRNAGGIEMRRGDDSWVAKVRIRGVVRGLFEK